MTYELFFHEDASDALLGLDNSVRLLLLRRIKRMRDEPPGRHLCHGLGFFVCEVGQYRVVYTCDGSNKTIFFVGNHKDYERWYASQ